jgi:hypothetical protein
VPVPSQPYQPPPGLDVLDYSVKQGRLDDATNRYAEIIARQRLTHGTALLANEGQINPAFRFIRRLGATALDPFAFRDYRRADDLAAQAADARRTYLEALTEYVDAAKANPYDQVRLRVGVMDNFERQVSQHMLDLADPPPPQGRGGQRMHGFREWMTNFWVNGSEPRRAAMVAVPMLGVGAVAGALVGAANPPPEFLLGAWYVVSAAGSSVGTAMARVVSRLRLARTDIHQGLQQEAFTLNRQFASRFTGLWQPTHGDIDVTEAYQARTLAVSHDNLRRLRLAQVAGASAAAIGFGLSDLSVRALTGMAAAHPPAVHNQPTPTPTRTPTPAPTPPPTPTPSLPPGVNLNDFPWNVAHHLDPNHSALELVKDTVGPWNAAHPQEQYWLAYHATTNRWVLQQGSQPVSGQALHDFNQFMVNLFGTAGRG